MHSATKVFLNPMHRFLYVCGTCTHVSTQIIHHLVGSIVSNEETRFFPFSSVNSSMHLLRMFLTSVDRAPISFLKYPLGQLLQSVYRTTFDCFLARVIFHATNRSSVFASIRLYSLYGDTLYCKTNYPIPPPRQLFDSSFKRSVSFEKESYEKLFLPWAILTVGPPSCLHS